VNTPGLGESISGAILFDETIRQRKKDGTPFVKALNDAGIISGIRAKCNQAKRRGEYDDELENHIQYNMVYKPQI
jgi:fructose-bisphosphate aldolase class I